VRYLLDIFVVSRDQLRLFGVVRLAVCFDVDSKAACKGEKASNERKSCRMCEMPAGRLLYTLLLSEAM
jgi:hypothetical protein